MLVGGIVVDRSSRLRLMVVSDVLRGVSVLVIAGLAAAHALELRHLLALGVVFGAVSAFFDPAYAAVAALVVGAANTALNLAWTSSLQDLVPGDRLGRVTSIDAVGAQSSPRIEGCSNPRTMLTPEARLPATNTVAAP